MGTQVGNYELLHEQMRSGPSTFFQAKNVILGNPVLVRRLDIDPSRADDVRSTFFREMRHAAGLQHPAVMRPIDVLETQGYLWSVHDVRRGTPSDARVQESGPLTLSDACRYGSEVADAIAYMHARGFVHGRVAPRWILLDDHGVQLVAFTKSADLAAGIWPLRPAVASFSPFTPPEELSGAKPSIEGDLYGFAASVVFWLTGLFPRDGRTPEEAQARAKGDAKPVDLRTLRPDVPAVLANALVTALEADPKERHGSVSSLGSLLVETYRRIAAEVPSGFETGVNLVPTGSKESLQILGRHGSGAFGVVFKARTTDGSCTVAVKALKPEHRHDTDARERFLREAQALQGISHPNVVRIHGVGEEAGTPYAVMDFIEGPDLGTLLLREGAMPPPRVVRLGMGLARGLEAIHREGILHRDLKPHNILVAPGDRPVIADFGVARTLDATRLTMTGHVVGTPAYMAPEQFEDAAPTFAVDLYAVGAILYEMLTGKAPFEGRDAISTIRAIRESAPAPMQVEVPERLASLVAGLLEKDPLKRPASAGAVAEALEDTCAAVDHACEAEPLRGVCADPE